MKQLEVRVTEVLTLESPQIASSQSLQVDGHIVAALLVDLQVLGSVPHGRQSWSTVHVQEVLQTLHLRRIPHRLIAWHGGQFWNHQESTWRLVVFRLSSRQHLLHQLLLILRILVRADYGGRLLYCVGRSARPQLPLRRYSWSGSTHFERRSGARAVLGKIF